MRSFPALKTAELAKANMMPVHLFKLVAASTYRFNDIDRKIKFDGNYWLPRRIEFGSFNNEMAGGIPSFRLTAPNLDKWFSDLHLSEDLRGKFLTIYRVEVDRSLKVIGYEAESEIDPIFTGPIDAPKDLNRAKAVFDVVSHRITEKGEGPRRNHVPECQHTFKDAASKVLGSDSNTYTCIIPHIGHAATKPVTGANWEDVWVLAGSGGAAYVVGARYKPGTCRYAGAETSCDHTRTTCKDVMNNFDNFGGDEFIPDLANPVKWGEREKSWMGAK